jgi:hypothetical protein
MATRSVYASWRSLPGFLAVAAGLFELHGGLGCVRELGCGDGLLSMGYHRLLDGQSDGQHLAG